VAQLGESKYIDELNIESQKDYSKNYVDLTEDQRNTILRRVTARQAYKKVDPSKNQNLLIQNKTEKKLKKFVKDFKEKNKRLPSRKEITRQANTDYNSVIKYLDEGKDYLTKAESTKLKDPPRPIQDLNPAQKKWYKANKNFLFFDKNFKYKKMPDDFMSLNNVERTKVRTDYINRATTGLNSPKARLERNKKTLEDFLQSEINKVKPGQNVVFNGQRKQFLEKNKLPIFDADETKKIFDKFNGRFVFENQKLLEIPGIEKKIIELAKTKGPAEIIQTLTEEKLIPNQNIGKSLKDGTSKFSYKAIQTALNTLLKEKKISKILPMDPTQGPKDKLVKDFIKNNPTEESIHRIAKGISANENIKISTNFVKNSIERLGLKNNFVSLHAKIYPQVKSLDKIIKRASKIINDPNINATDKFKFLAKEYAKATKQPLEEATSQLKARLEKVGSLYQKTSERRYETALYDTINKPINFNDKFAANLIEIASRAKTQLNNSSVARMMGLPAKDITLIDNLAKVGTGLGVKVAGDHTDIKALMKNYPSYKKNFLRIQLISDKLNEFKGKSFDRKIIALEKKARLGNRRVREDALEEMKKLQKEFKKLTGADIGIPDIRDGRIILDESKMIPRLDELKNPMNETVRQGMINLETSAAPGETPSKFTNTVDKLLKNATSAAQRINIFKKYQGTKAIQESKAVKGLSKLPGPVGKAFKAITLGLASIGAMSVAANAGETNQTEGQVALLEKSQVKQPTFSEPLKYDATQGSIVNANTDQKADQNQILEYVKDNPLKVTAGTSLGFAAQEVPGAYKAARDLGRGRIRSTLGISGAIRPVLTTFGTPLITGLYEGAIGAKRLDEGETMTDILTDPVGPALGLTLMEPLSKLSGVVRDAPKRTMLEGARNYFNLSNVGQARPGLTGQILRMGLSPRMIAGASRFLGLPGIALGAGLAGYDAYKNYQNQEGMIYNLFNKDG